MGKKILFVDDSVSMRNVVGLALRNAGYDVATAADGVEGEGKLSECRYDAIITDLNMPRKNGIEFINAVKAHPNNRFSPIVMLTTESAEDMKRQGQAAGARVWMVKPFKPEQLLAVLTKLIG